MDNPWKTLSLKEVYDNRWINVSHHEVINPSGGNGIYGVVHFKNLAIGILAIDEDDMVYVVGQYRYAINQYSIELPEGGGPHDEDPLKAAQRELLEETGLKAEHWELFLTMHLSNSVTDEKAIIYLAKSFTQHSNALEETEDITVVKMPFGELLNKILIGEITDAITVAAVLKYAYLRNTHQNQ